MNALVRARIGLLALMLVIALAPAGRVFDRSHPSLLVPVAFISATAVLVVGRRGIQRFGAWLGAALLGLLAVLLIERGSISDLFSALVVGPGELLSTEWPSPNEPRLVLTIGWALVLLGGLSLDLAGRRRWHLVPLLPTLLLWGLLVALAAPSGPRMLWIAPLAVIGAAFATLRPGSSWTRRLNALSGERRLIPALLAVLMAALIPTVLIDLDGRADPRQPPEIGVPDTLIGPLEAVRALTLLGSVPIFDVAMDEDDTPQRWRTAVLERYDGERWTPGITLRQIGPTLRPGVEPDIRATVTFRDVTLPLLPIPGPLVSMSRDAATDEQRSIVVLDDLSVGDSVTLTALSPPVFDPTQMVPFERSASRNDDIAAAGFGGALTEALGASTTLGQLIALESTLANTFLLTDAQVGKGLQRTRLDQFLLTEFGNEEQFAAAFVMLAHSYGMRARLAVGFLADEPSNQITAEMASVWPEVLMQTDDGLEWIPFDPFPDSKADEPDDETAESPTLTPTDEQPLAQQEDRGDGGDSEATESSIDETSALRRFVTTALRVTGISGLLMLPLLLVAGGILLAKRRRRRLLLSVEEPDLKIRAHWVLATNDLIDAGLDITDSDTDADVANNAVPLVPAAEVEVQRLASLARQATFGSPRRADVLVLDAEACHGHINESLAHDRTLLQRLRWRLALRSLRRSTRSPVEPSG